MNRKYDYIKNSAVLRLPESYGDYENPSGEMPCAYTCCGGMTLKRMIYKQRVYAYKRRKISMYGVLLVTHEKRVASSSERWEEPSICSQFWSSKKKKRCSYTRLMNRQVQ